MSLSLKPSHLKRYKDVLHLFFKYGQSGLFKDAGLDPDLKAEIQALTPESTAKAQELAGDLEKMGPTFIKLGQLLSTRADLLSPAYIDALTRLQDKIEPEPGEAILEAITQELGVKVSRAFPQFDLKPLATASLGQVHRATLRDGREVVIKVQRPGVRERVMEDMEALTEIAELLDNHTQLGKRYQFVKMVEEFRRSLLRELDYLQEARNLGILAQNLKEFDRIVVPLALEDFTTPHVLTMEYIQGFKVSSLSPLARVEVHGAELADQLFRAYLKQILVDGFVHADPHPGNVFVTEDGRLALLDLGMVLRLSPPIQDILIELLLAISEGRGDEAAAAVLRLAEEDEVVKRDTFLRQLHDLIARFQDSKLKDFDIGRVLLEVARAAIECGYRLPPEIGMVGQTLLKLDSVGRRLAPEFKTNEAIRQNTLKLMQQRMLKGESLGSLFKCGVELKDFVLHLPGRVGKILDVVADNKLKIEVQAIDESRLMQGLQKIANRITLGLVLASLIIGAALLMRVETHFRLFGFPGLAILLFGSAVLGIFFLVGTIVIRDVSGPLHRVISRRDARP